MRIVQAGSEISLRVSFKNDLGAVVQATGVSLSIFPPGVDTTIIANALVQNVVPSYLGNGLFEYNYIVPSAAVEGTWTDVWQGSIGSTPLTSNMTFSVTVSGTITTANSQIYKNNIITITIPTKIKSLDGLSLLSTPYSFSYMTSISPYYTDIRKVRLEIGSFISDMVNHTVQTAILEASLEVDATGLKNLNSIDNYLIHARREYTTCLASKILLTNLLNNQLKSKTLDNLSVSYDVNGIRDALSGVDDCLAKWSRIVAPIRNRDPKMVVKGALDPDRPNIGRGWNNVQTTPIANSNFTPRGSRRSVSVYTPRGLNRKWW